MPGDINFCQRCGHQLAEKAIEGKMRPHCPGCGFIMFLDPKVAAVVLVSLDNKLVLVQRNIEPAFGRWSFPSGYVDRGEVVEDAAVREVREETGLVVRLNDFVGLYSSNGHAVILAVYSAEVVGGKLEAGEEAQDVGLFAVDELPDLPFPHDSQILRDWQALDSC